MLVSFDTRFLGETRNSVGMARPSQSGVFLVEPDKFKIKRHFRGFLFIMHF